MVIISEAPPGNSATFAYKSADLKHQAHVCSVLQHVPQLADDFFDYYFYGFRISFADLGNGGIVEGLNWTILLIVFEGGGVVDLHKLIQIGPAAGLIKELLEHAEPNLLLFRFSEASEGV